MIGTVPDYLGGLAPISDVVRRYELNPRKAFGQNFLFDFQLLEKIARYGGAASGARIVEVGPGPGGLTRALLARGARVLSLEKDKRFAPALDEIKAMAGNDFDYYVCDALTFVPRKPWLGARVIANLPYQIATPLMVRWLTAGLDKPWFSNLTLMMQKEVSDRLVAKPGDKAYGRLSVFVAWCADVEHLFDVPREAFFPPPKVTSSLVSLKPKLDPLPCNREAFSDVLRLAFGHRRKMLRASLKGWLNGDISKLESIGIDPAARPETLGLEQFIALSQLNS